MEETARRDQADTALIEQIDAELECLQSQVAVNSLPAEESSDAVGLDSLDNSASAAVSTDAGAGSALSGSELTEYMLRIRNRRNLALKADAIDQNDPNNQKVRANWSLDDGADGNGNGNGFNTRSMQNYSQQNTSSAEKHGGRNYTESSSRDRSRITAPRSSSHRGGGGAGAASATSQDREEGEDGEENESSSTDHSNQDSHPANNRKETSYLRKHDMPAVSDAVEDDSAPPESNEGADEGEVEEEEDEAEQLLAALGGR